MKNKLINFLKVHKPLLITFGVVLLVALFLGLTCVGVATMDTSDNKLAHAEEDFIYTYDYEGITYSGYNIYNPFEEMPINDMGSIDLEIDEVHNDLTRNGINGTFLISGDGNIHVDGYFYYDLLDEMHYSYYGYLGNFTLSFSFGLKNIPEVFYLEPIQYRISINYSDGDVYESELYDLASYDYDNPSYNYLNFSVNRRADVINVRLKVFIYGGWTGDFDNLVNYRFDNVQLVDGDRELPFSNWYTQIQDIGYDAGYDVGYDAGYDVGYDEGQLSMSQNLIRPPYDFGRSGPPNTIYDASGMYGDVNSSRDLIVTTTSTSNFTSLDYYVYLNIDIPISGYYSFSLSEIVNNNIYGTDTGASWTYSYMYFPLLDSYYYSVPDSELPYNSPFLGIDELRVKSSYYINEITGLPKSIDFYFDKSQNEFFTIRFGILNSRTATSTNNKWTFEGLKLINSDLKISYDRYFDLGYGEGYDVGYDEGQGVGYGEGYGEGYDSGIFYGRTQGYYEGYDEGYDVANNTITTTSASYTAGYNSGVEGANNFTFNSLLSAVFDVPVRTLLSLLNFEILGVDMSSFFLSLITICVVLFVIRLILGR